MRLRLDNSKPYAVVLEGGGARGAYQVGVWKAMDEAGVRYNAVEIATESDYPGMEYNPNSAMRGLFAQLVREEFGCELQEESTHGGMEIGYFARSIPGVDIVTLGPISEGCHSPSERMNLESFNRMYGVLAKLVELTD